MEGTKDLNLEQFKQEKITAREEAFDKAMETLKGINPVAIHQWGSGATGYRDEFSDIDLLVTLDDKNYAEIMEKREELYAEVSPILVYIKTPLKDEEGIRSYYHDLVLYDTARGLVHIDYYLFPKSTAVVPTGAKLLFGNENLPERKDALIGKTEDDPDKSLSRQLNGILAMSYIGIKALTRYWDKDFLGWVQGLYDGYVKQAGLELEALPETKDFTLIDKILSNLATEGNEKQQIANKKIRELVKTVEHLYPKS